MYDRVGVQQPLSARIRHAAAETPAAGDRERLSFLAKLALVSMLVPAYFFVGSFKLSPSKALFLALVPILTVQLLRGRYGRLLAADIFIFALAVWMTLAMLANHTPAVAIEYTGSNTIIILGGYLTARATIRTKGAFVALIRFLALVVVISLPFAIYETITSKTTIPRWLGEIPNVFSHGDLNHDPRMGLWRVQFVFAHPIHYGIFCSLAFSLVYVGLVNTTGRLRRLVTSGIVALCCFLSLSSGPLIALMSQIGLIGWSAATRGVGHRWRLLAFLLLIVYVVIEVMTNRPGIYSVVSRLSFSTGTAYARLVLFEYGMDQVWRAPILGIGYNPWPLPAWMTGSTDNFWLFLALKFGIPAFVFFAGAFLAPMIRIGRRDFGGDSDLMALRRAWIFTMVSVCLVLATVAIWGELYSIVLFVLGSGMWLAYVEPRPNASPASPAAFASRRAPHHA